MISDTQTKFISELSSVNRTGIYDLIQYLIDNRFFFERASKKHHNAFPGGLAKHSLDVLAAFREKIHFYNLDVSPDSAIIVSLLHDLCKLGMYIHDINTEELITDDQFPVGHGEKSIFMAQRYIKLSDQEIALIRWHMGYFEGGLAESYTRKSWRAAMDRYPEIVAFHCADWEASKYG